MPNLTRHYRLLAAALPNKEKRIRTSYGPTLVLVVAASTVAFVVLELGWFVITHNVYNVVPIHELLAFEKNYCPAPGNSKTTPQPNCPPPFAVL
jgi:hypothetical protein